MFLSIAGRFIEQVRFSYLLGFIAFNVIFINLL